MSTVVEVPPCDCCGSPYWPRERLRSQGVDLVICADYRHCIERALVSGRWQGRAR